MITLMMSTRDVPCVCFRSSEPPAGAVPDDKKKHKLPKKRYIFSPRSK